MRTNRPGEFPAPAPQDEPKKVHGLCGKPGNNTGKTMEQRPHGLYVKGPAKDDGRTTATKRMKRYCRAWRERLEPWGLWETHQDAVERAARFHLRAWRWEQFETRETRLGRDPGAMPAHLIPLVGKARIIEGQLEEAIQRERRWGEPAERGAAACGSMGTGDLDAALACANDPERASQFLLAALKGEPLFPDAGNHATAESPIDPEEAAHAYRQLQEEAAARAGADWSPSPITEPRTYDPRPEDEEPRDDPETEDEQPWEDDPETEDEPAPQPQAAPQPSNDPARAWRERDSLIKAPLGPGFLVRHGIAR